MSGEVDDKTAAAMISSFEHLDNLDIDDNLATTIALLERWRITTLEHFERPTEEEGLFYGSLDNNEIQASVMYVPHDEHYKRIYDMLKEDDVVMDMGAGDFRFDLIAARKVKRIYALELCPTIVRNAMAIISYSQPKNMITMCGDWNSFEIPPDVTVILIMANGADEKKMLEAWRSPGRRFIFSDTSKENEIWTRGSI